MIKSGGKTLISSFDSKPQTVTIKEIRAINGDWQIILSDGKLLGGVTDVHISSETKMISLKVYPLKS